jgi:hypothetical protein
VGAGDGARRQGPADTHQMSADQDHGHRDRGDRGGIEELPALAQRRMMLGAGGRSQVGFLAISRAPRPGCARRGGPSSPPPAARAR